MKFRYLYLLLFLILTIKTNSQPSETIYLGTVARAGYTNNNSYGPFNIGFNFTFYGNTYSQFYVSSNGLVTFGSGSIAETEDPIPTSTLPNNFIAPLWDDLIIDPFGSILYSTVGASPGRKLVIQFRNMAFYNTPIYMGTFYVILYESINKVQIQYRTVVLPTSERATGGSASIGIENSDGTSGLQFSYQTPFIISSGKAISFTPSGVDYTLNSNDLYDGIYLTTNLNNPEPGTTGLITPANNAVIGIDHTFEWSETPNVASYSLQISTNSSMTGATSYDAGSGLTYYISGLSPGTTYYWTVFATNSTGTTWNEVRSFTTSSTPPLTAVPQTAWTEQTQEKTIKLNFSGGDASAKTAIITSLPVQGQLYQYIAGVKGALISSFPIDVTDPNRNVIYVANGSSGNGAGNFNFKIHDDTGDSPDALVTVNVSPPGMPNLMYTGKAATYVEMQFDRTMANPSGKEDQFTVTVNSSPASFSSLSLKTGDPYTIVATLSSPIVLTDAVTIAYAAGNITSTSGGLLASFDAQTVSLRAQTITFTTNLTKKFNESPFTLSATASSGLSMTYSSSNQTVATISGNSVTLKSVGSSDITARQAGNATYTPAKYIRTLTVSKGDQTITFNPLANKTVGDPDFSPGATASSGLIVSYFSDNSAVATIVGGLIHIVGAGTSNIIASQSGNTNYNPAVDVIQPFTVDVLTTIDNPFSSINSFRIFTSYGIINIQTLSDEWNTQTGSVRILNIIGHTVTDIHFTEFSKDSPITFQSPSPKGLYVVEIRAGAKRFVGKVVVN